MSPLTFSIPILPKFHSDFALGELLENVQISQIIIPPSELNYFHLSLPAPLPVTPRSIILNNIFFKLHFTQPLLNKLNKNILLSNLTPSQFSPALIVRFLQTSQIQKPQALHPTTPSMLLIIRFFEFMTNRQVSIISKHISMKNLPLQFQIRLNLWLPKLSNFKKVFGKNFPLAPTLELLMLSLYIKDVNMLSSWFKHVFRRISFWKYRLIFHFIRYILRSFFWPIFSDLQIKGLKFRFKGKISVAGNARTRNVNFAIGQSSSSTKNLRVLYKLLLVPSFTGVMAFQIWLFF